jgi:acyl carrier protein phosphodiesterase
VLTGNLVSDFVKGKRQFDFPRGIRDGIILHRAIDGFTDTHPAPQQAKSFFRPAYRLYSGAIVDVLYDHFLANDPAEFPGDSLAVFAANAYRQLSGCSAFFPERFARLFPYMQEHNWLLNYRTKEGIFSSLSGLARRAAYMPGPEAANTLFETHYTELEACYRDFFPFMKGFAEGMLQNLLKIP